MLVIHATSNDFGVTAFQGPFEVLTQGRNGFFPSELYRRRNRKHGTEGGHDSVLILHIKRSE